jgi:cyclopropane-fatty-acyl-phospholipid synthase
MNLTELAEGAVFPDWLIRLGIRRLLAARLQMERRRSTVEPRGYLREFVEELRRSPIALATDSANLQHYEVPAGFCPWRCSSTSATTRSCSPAFRRG